MGIFLICLVFLILALTLLLGLSILRESVVDLADGLGLSSSLGDMLLGLILVALSVMGAWALIHSG